jgi:hypothetical protein
MICTARMILGLIIVLLVAFWYTTRIRNKELFQSGITVKDIECTAQMPERIYNPAPIPANTPIPNIQIDITPYIQGDIKWKIDLRQVANYYAPNAGSNRSDAQSKLYIESLETLYTYRNIMEQLFKSYNLPCWRNHTRVCLYLMNCNSMLIPFMTKAATITSLTDEKARRNNFKELLKDSRYTFLNSEYPFGTHVYDCPPFHWIVRGNSTTGTFDDCVKYASITSWNGSVLASAPHQGNFEACHVFMRLIANTLLMRVNISELREPEWHKDIDDLFLWYDKVMQYLGTNLRTNNIYLIKIVPIMLAFLGRCRKLDKIAIEVEKFLDIQFSIKEGFIWTETNRDNAVINYHLYFLSMMWIIFITFQATSTPFPFAKYKNQLKKIVDNAVVEVYISAKIKEKGWTGQQFHDVMTIALEREGIRLVNGTLSGLTSAATGSPQATQCLYKPPPPCGAPVPTSSTAHCNCSTKKITMSWILNAMDTIQPPSPSSTSPIYYTTDRMKIILFYTCLGDFAFVDRCPSYNISADKNPRTADFYKYFYEEGPLPDSFTTGFHMPVSTYMSALRKWVEVEQPPVCSTLVERYTSLMNKQSLQKVEIPPLYKPTGFGDTIADIDAYKKAMAEYNELRDTIVSLSSPGNCYNRNKCLELLKKCQQDDALKVVSPSSILVVMSGLCDIMNGICRLKASDLKKQPGRLSEYADIDPWLNKIVLRLEVPFRVHLNNIQLLRLRFLAISAARNQNITDLTKVKNDVISVIDNNMYTATNNGKIWIDNATASKTGSYNFRCGFVISEGARRENILHYNQFYMGFLWSLMLVFKAASESLFKDFYKYKYDIGLIVKNISMATLLPPNTHPDEINTAQTKIYIDRYKDLYTSIGQTLTNMPPLPNSLRNYHLTMYKFFYGEFEPNKPNPTCDARSTNYRPDPSAANIESLRSTEQVLFEAYSTLFKT